MNSNKCPKNPNDGGHFWKIEEANGPISEARCKYCGIHSLFSNTPHEFPEDKAVVLESGRYSGASK